MHSTRHRVINCKFC